MPSLCPPVLSARSSAALLIWCREGKKETRARKELLSAEAAPGESQCCQPGLVSGKRGPTGCHGVSCREEAGDARVPRGAPREPLGPLAPAGITALVSLSPSLGFPRLVKRKAGHAAGCRYLPGARIRAVRQQLSPAPRSRGEAKSPKPSSCFWQEGGKSPSASGSKEGWLGSESCRLGHGKTGLYS